MADSYEPLNSGARAMAKLRRMVALSSTFRSKKAGVTDADKYQDAFDSIYYEYAPTADEISAENGGETSVAGMPFAAIWPVAVQSQAVCGGSQNHVRPRGQLLLVLYCEPDEEQTTWNDRRLAACDFLDGWCDEIAALSAKDDDEVLGTPVVDGEGHLCMTMIDAQITEHVPLKMRQSGGNYYWRSVMISFGDD